MTRAAAFVLALLVAAAPAARAHEAAPGTFSQTKSAGDGLVTLQVDPATTGRNAVLVDVDLPDVGLTDEIGGEVLFVMHGESVRVDLDPAGPGHAEGSLRLHTPGTWSASVVVDTPGGTTAASFDVPVAPSQHDDRVDPLTFVALLIGSMLTVAAMTVLVFGRRRAPA